MINSIGPKTDPWETPLFIWIQSEALPINTLYSWSVSQFSIHLQRLPVMLWALTLLISCLCGTLLNAFWKSRCTLFTDLVLSYILFTSLKKSIRLVSLSILGEIVSMLGVLYIIILLIVNTTFFAWNVYKCWGSLFSTVKIDAKKLVRISATMV